jgi:serine protease AprX
VERRELEQWLFGVGQTQRRTQDSPILPDVWFAYALPEELQPVDRDTLPLVAGGTSRAPSEAESADSEPLSERRVDLLMRPHDRSSSPLLASAIAKHVQADPRQTLLAWNDLYVAARLTFRELVADVLPLSRWWQEYLLPTPAPKKTTRARNTAQAPAARARRRRFSALVSAQRKDIAAIFRGERPGHETRRAVHKDDLSADLVWLVGIVGRIAWEWSPKRSEAEDGPPTAEQVVDAAIEVLGETMLGWQEDKTPLWSVSRNRPVASSVWRSRITMKADAATRLFKLSCRDIRWGVLDSGIDARHPAFARRDNDGAATAKGVNAADAAGSRVIATYDFSNIRQLLAERFASPATGEGGTAGTNAPLVLNDPGAAEVDRVESWVGSGRNVDWAALQGALAIRHDGQYKAPEDEHGTHVAGILGADWRPDDDARSGEHHVEGICPDIELVDLRVLGPDGSGEEFSILSAMQFVRYLNAHADRPVIHGVNLSFAVRHEVTKFAAGRTPVCEEADRLVASGVVVVAAAGNDGRAGYVVRGRSVEGYRTVSIADPGNAESVITVGATHRSEPHTYGVSYFSSRGPTGDGRAKPDLVAPGEKIVAPVPELGLKSLDGTSQAAPHVSGAAALLLARHPELIGQPLRVKEILCASATDLGRVPSFQGAGMVDVLRAIQEV